MTKFFNTIIKSPFINIFVVTTLVMFIANIYKIYFFEGTDRIALMHMARSLTTIFLLNLVITHVLYLLSRGLFKGLYLVYALIIFILCEAVSKGSKSCKSTSPFTLHSNKIAARSVSTSIAK